jgi:hypothetical protein
MAAMEPRTTFRPRVSRETRLLLTAALVAVAVLWLLARVRFRDRPAPPSPIPAVLGQLTGGPTLDELASEIAAVTTRIRPAVVAIGAAAAPAPDARSPARVAALRVRDGVAVAWLPATRVTPPAGLIAIDRAAGLALVRVPGGRPTALPALWTPAAPQRPRYVAATEIVGGEVSVRPTFVPALEAVVTPLWPEPAWAVPSGSALTAGSLVFTSDAALVGLVIPSAGRLVIVPGATLLAQAERLLAAPPAPAGSLGIEVQGLTPALASVTGAASGVVVSWVDPAGPARGRVGVGDVIETVNGRPVTGPGEWDVLAARLSAGTTVTLGLRARGTSQPVELTAGAAAPPSSAALGLTLRARGGTGSEIVAVQPGSAAHRAGLTAADVITLVGEAKSPTPRQVTRAFASLRPGERLLVAVTRGDAHTVTTLERPE